MITLVLRLQDPPSVSERAAALAREHGASLDVLLVMDSRLYHYGHNDVVVPGKARAGFLTYISSEVAEAGRKRADALMAEAAELDVPIRIEPIMEEDCRSQLEARLARSDGPVIAAKGKRTVFPIFKNDPVEAALKQSGREVVRV